MRSRTIHEKAVGHKYGCPFSSHVKEGFSSLGYIQLKLSLRKGYEKKHLWDGEIGLFPHPRARRDRTPSLDIVEAEYTPVRRTPSLPVRRWDTCTFAKRGVFTVVGL